MSYTQPEDLAKALQSKLEEIPEKDIFDVKLSTAFDSDNHEMRYTAIILWR